MGNTITENKLVRIKIEDAHRVFGLPEQGIFWHQFELPSGHAVRILEQTRRHYVVDWKGADADELAHLIGLNDVHLEPVSDEKQATLLRNAAAQYVSYLAEQVPQCADPEESRLMASVMLANAQMVEHWASKLAPKEDNDA